MKKSLFLLPLLAAMALCGCGEEKGGGGSGGGGGGGDTPVSEDIEIDFTVEGAIEFPYVSDISTLNSVEYDGINYNSMGAYDDVYEGNYHLNFALKKLAGDGKVEEGENMPFFANADAYDKAIKSVEVVVSELTGGVDFYVDFPEAAVEAITAGSESGTKKSVSASTSTTFTVTNKGTGKYFSICSSKAVNAYRKNGKIAKIIIHF